jgi:hypothetical protein
MKSNGCIHDQRNVWGFYEPKARVIVSAADGKPVPVLVSLSSFMGASRHRNVETKALPQVTPEDPLRQASTSI